VLVIGFGALPASAAAPKVKSDVVSTSSLMTLEQVTTSSIDDLDQTDSNVVALEVKSYFADVPVLAAVAQCESQYQQFNADGTIHRGVVNAKDVGVMQINEHYHLKTAEKLGYDIYTLAGNIGYARYLYNQQGLAPWSASSGCWGKTAKLLLGKAQLPNTLAANLLK